MARAMGPTSYAGSTSVSVQRVILGITGHRSSHRSAPAAVEVATSPSGTGRPRPAGAGVGGTSPALSTGARHDDSDHRGVRYPEYRRMTRSQGFARGDLDTSFPLDDKFLALRGRLDADRYYAATGVYWTVVAATWREADRKVAVRVAPDAPSLIDELVAVGLLDEDGRVPSRAFSNSVGRAKRARKAATARQNRKRAEETAKPPSSSPVSLVPTSRSVTPVSRVTPRDTVGTVGTNGTGRTPARERTLAEEDEELKDAIARRVGVTR